MSEESTVQRFEVVVAGAGPVGLSTALFLAHRGVRVLVVDKRDPLDGPPRASTTLRTLELFRSIGLGPALDRVGWNGPLPMHTVIKDSATGSVLHQAAPPPDYVERLISCSPVDARRVMTQYELQRVALTQLRHLGAQVRFGVELLDFSTDAETVNVRMADTATGHECRVFSSYLVGADGTHSRVRELAGIDMPDRQIDARMNTAFFRADLRDLLPEAATHSCFIRNKDVYCTLFVKGSAGDRWTSHVLDYPGKPAELTPLSAEQTLRLLRAAIGDDTLPIDLLDRKAWEASICIASALRRDRVFLVGDAAHVQSSAGGLGMNTGIQDGHNLAWKLAAVLRGQAGESLLDSYEPERRSAAEVSLTLSRRLLHGYRTQQDNNQLYAQLAVDYLRGMMLYRYDSRAVLTDDTDDATASGVAAGQATPGCRLPHRWLADGDRRLSTLDLTGTGWTLLTGPEGTGWATANTDQLRVRQVTPAMVHGDSTAFTDLAGTEPDGALLVRPDGFVAWRSRGLPAAPDGAVRSAMHALLGHS